MAETFYRIPIVGGDSNVWAQYLLAQTDNVLGTLSGRLYNSGGTLYVPPCRIGIDNGLDRGTAIITAAKAISLAGCSNSNWLAIEAAVSGSAVTFSATDIAGATDLTIIPASVRAAWDGEKNGFYLTASKRLISLACKNSAGTLMGIISFEGEKIWLSSLYTTKQYGPGQGMKFVLGDWDMNTDSALILTYVPSLEGFFKAIQYVSCMIFNDAGTLYTPLSMATDGVDPGLLAGGFNSINPALGTITFTRRTGSIYDHVNYDSAGYNRGYYALHFREF